MEKITKRMSNQKKYVMSHELSLDIEFNTNLLQNIIQYSRFLITRSSRGKTNFLLTKNVELSKT